jgi:hypothetical protein
MVYCRQCRKKVQDCEHFVYPIQAPRRLVWDEKVESLAYSDQKRILEIAFKNGQCWQLFDVKPGLYAELQASTISSFLKSIAHRYRAAPVKTGMSAILIPESEKCSKCGSSMREKHRAGSNFEQFLRVLWSCPSCSASAWKKYGSGIERERRGRWY